MSFLHSVIFLIVDNVELTSNKERQFTCPGDQVVFTCRVFVSTSLEWRSPLITQTASYVVGDTPPGTLPRGPLTASLINVSGTNFTSTLQVTASQMIMSNETTVMCLSTTANKTDNFTIAGEWMYFVCMFLVLSLINAPQYSIGQRFLYLQKWLI